MLSQPLHFRRPPSGARPVVALRFVAVVLALVAGGGCRRDDVAVYEAPKDAPAAAMPASPHGAGGGGGEMMGGVPEARPGLKWKQLPPGWTARGASGMRVANFTVPGPDNGQADLAVIPLPGTGGADLDLVNLWRGQLNLSPIAEAQLATHTDEGRMGEQAYKLFSIVGSDGADSSAAGKQILVAAIRREGFTWFFKLAGDTATVAANREALKGFLAAVEFTAPAAAHAGMGTPGSGAVGPFAGGAAAGSAPPPSGGTPTPEWKVPAAWKSVPPTQMVHSKWTVGSGASGSGEVAVSVFPGEAGGLVANLNRWRAKVALAPAPDSELQAFADNLEVHGGKASSVDFTGSDPETGGPSRLVGAIVRRDGWSWYYKFTAAPAVIEAHREAFLQFVKTAQYPRGQ